MPPGDILVFLTGQEEIESLSLLLQDKLKLLPKDALTLLVCLQTYPYHRSTHSMPPCLLTSNWLCSLQLLLSVARWFYLPISLNPQSPFKGSSMWLILEWWRSVWVRQPLDSSPSWLCPLRNRMHGNEQVVLDEKVKEKWTWWKCNDSSVFVYTLKMPSWDWQKTRFLRFNDAISQVSFFRWEDGDSLTSSWRRLEWMMFLDSTIWKPLRVIPWSELFSSYLC